MLLSFQIKLTECYTTGAPRTTALAKEYIAIIKSQRTKHAKALKRTEYGIRETDNPFFKLKKVDLYRYA